MKKGKKEKQREMGRMLLALLLTGVLLVGTLGFSEEAIPAATLLLPGVEVEIQGTGEVTPGSSTEEESTDTEGEEAEEDSEAAETEADLEVCQHSAGAFLALVEEGVFSLEMPESLRIDEEEGVFVFSPGDQVMLSASEYDFRITLDDGEVITAQAGEILLFAETVTVVKLELFFREEEEEEPLWHPVELFSQGLVLAFDDLSPELSIYLPEANAYGYYHEDVCVSVHLAEEEYYSGLTLVEYRIVNEGEETDSGLWQLEQEQEFSGEITILAESNNGEAVTVELQATDAAGNVTTTTFTLKICTISPKIHVASADKAVTLEGDYGYFSEERQLVLTIEDVDGVFDEALATAGISIAYAGDLSGELTPVTEEALTQILGQWQTEAGEENLHTMVLTFPEEGRYAIGLSYTNRADLAAEEISGEGESLWAFTQDFTSPEGEVTILTCTWTNWLVTTLRFGLVTAEDTTVLACGWDALSPLASLDYVYTSDLVALSQRELEALDETAWLSASPAGGELFSVEGDARFTVYVRLRDYAGNLSYCSSDGVIVDTLSPRLVLEDEGLEYYAGDVALTITAEDAAEDGVYSGLASLTYRVVCDGEETAGGTLFQYAVLTPGYEELCQTWSGSITVDSAQNNSNQVVVEVIATDRAGNATTKRLSVSIDTTQPTMQISYDNNQSVNGLYYAQARVATIRVTERNFDPALVIVEVNGETCASTMLSDWTLVSRGSANGDDAVYEATLTFAEDGEYALAISCTDRAGNAAKTPTFAQDTTNATHFIVDQTAPRISITYDNNQAHNQYYFQTARVATVTILEENLNPEEVELSLSAVLHGETLASPSVSWVHLGSVHTATIFFRTDGEYTLLVSAVDAAGNVSGQADSGDSAAPYAFVIDTGIEQLEVTGVEDGCAYGAGISFAVTLRDEHLSSYALRMTKTNLSTADAEVTELLVASEWDETGGILLCEGIPGIQENDGIYTLWISAEDLAGNMLEKQLVFSVNRFGSVYTFASYLTALVEDGGAYCQSIDEDLVIMEYNASPISVESLSITITRDGRPVSGVAYTFSSWKVDGREDGWYAYCYTIDKENFSADGVYKIVVSTEDQAGNTPENTSYRDILFRVDSTPPEITGFWEEGGSLTQELTVSYAVYDTIGLKSVEVYVDEELIDRVTSFADDVNNYTDTLSLGNAEAENAVTLVVEDLAGNVTDTVQMAGGKGTTTLQSLVNTQTRDTGATGTGGGRSRWLILPLGVAIGLGGAAAIANKRRKQKRSVG